MVPVEKPYELRIMVSLRLCINAERNYNATSDIFKGLFPLWIK